MHLALPRLLASLGAASLLAACSSAGGSAPAGAGSASLLPQSVAAQTAVSSAHGMPEHPDGASLRADPASLEFAAGATASQTVSITGRHGGTYDVSIAGTGTCPTVSPSSLKLEHADDDGGDRDHHGDGDRDKGHAATITVTPVSGAAGGISRGGTTGASGAAQCIITVTKHDRDAAGDAAEHENERGAVTLLIPVNVDAPVAPPSATPVPCGARGC